MTDRVGFVGLGIMGRGMAGNVHKAGFELGVYNRTREKAERFAEEHPGVLVAESLSALAAKSDCVVLCVSDTPDVEEVLFGERGIADGAAPGLLVIDCSTISPTETREFALRLGQMGVSMLDAPVSGGSEGAANATLSIMVGGEASAFERARPVLASMGRTITRVGPIGAGQTVKLVNQILVVGSMIAMAEALLFAQAGGLDLEKTLAAVSGGAAGSWTLSNRGPQVIRRDWRPGFTIDLQQKDLRLALQAGDQLGVPMQVCSTAFHYYRAVQERGGGSEGNHAIIKALEYLSGIQVGIPAEGKRRESDERTQH
jgi:3-hydroxyisobutyrate dehydrogenase